MRRGLVRSRAQGWTPNGGPVLLDSVPGGWSVGGMSRKAERKSVKLNRRFLQAQTDRMKTQKCYFSGILLQLTRREPKLKGHFVSIVMTDNH